MNDSGQELTIGQLYEYMEMRRRECAIVLDRFMDERRAAQAKGDNQSADRAWERYKITNSRYNLYGELAEAIRTGVLPS